MALNDSYYIKQFGTLVKSTNLYAGMVSAASITAFQAVGVGSNPTTCSTKNIMVYARLCVANCFSRILNKKQAAYRELVSMVSTTVSKTVGLSSSLRFPASYAGVHSCRV